MENTLINAKKYGFKDSLIKSIELINENSISHFYEYINIDSLQIFIKHYGSTIMKGMTDGKIDTTGII